MTDASPVRTGDYGSGSVHESPPAHLNEKFVPTAVRELLDSARADWRVVRHPPLDTIDQGLELLEDAGGLLILLVAKGITRPDLRQVRALVGCRRLHMASAATLRECLDTVPGRVSLLDLVGHRGKVDTVVLDGNLTATDRQTALPLGSDDISVCLPGSCLPDLARKLVSRVFILPGS